MGVIEQQKSKLAEFITSKTDDRFYKRSVCEIKKNVVRKDQTKIGDTVVRNERRER